MKVLTSCCEVSYPSVGEVRITLLNQDGFDHGCVHYTHHRLPAIVQPHNAIAVSLSVSRTYLMANLQYNVFLFN